jgi:hypothetical protein
LIGTSCAPFFKATISRNIVVYLGYAPSAGWPSRAYRVMTLSGGSLPSFFISRRAPGPLLSPVAAILIAAYSGDMALGSVLRQQLFEVTDLELRPSLPTLPWSIRADFATSSMLRWVSNAAQMAWLAQTGGKLNIDAQTNVAKATPPRRSSSWR